MPKPLISSLFLLGLLSISSDETTFGQTPVVGETESKLVGTWVWSLDVGPSDGKASLVVDVVDGKLVAKVTAPDGIVCKVEDLSIKNDRVSFSIARDMGIFHLVISHVGNLEADEITGTFHMKGGPLKKSGKWNAERVKKK